ncbi:MAG: hypothetical protein IPH13_02500 [Planctomycetes bacterium]|nr:hypothetical protein [Planctomycetota bacterium]
MKRPVLASFGAIAFALCGSLPAEELLFWNQPFVTQFGGGASYKAGLAVDTEIADDFECAGVVTRLYVDGSSCSSCTVPNLLGAHVRFYAWTPTGPGTLLSHEFLPATSEGFHVGQYGTLDLKLSQPFTPNGKAFVGVQMAFTGGGYWAWNYDWSNQTLSSPSVWGSSAYQRGATTGQGWVSGVQWVSSHVQAHMHFTVYGATGSPPDLGSDLCGSWAGVPAPDPAGSTHTVMRNVDVLDETDAWAVGEAYDVLPGQTTPVAMHWDGTTWTLVPTPIPSPGPASANCGLDAVKMIASNDVWAGGWQYKQDAAGYVGPHLFVIHWDGSQWTEVPTPMPATLGTQGGSGEFIHGIDASGPNDVWFVGEWMEALQNKRPALAMHWDGSNFTMFDTPLMHAKGDSLEAVAVIAHDDVWAVGGGKTSASGPNAYIVHWDGSSWTLQMTVTPGILSRLRDVKAIASNDIWACGETFVNNTYRTWFIHYDGSSWTEFMSPTGGAGLYAVASNDVYSVGGSVAHWDGTQWSTIVSAFGDALGVSMADVAGDGACGIMAVGREIIAGDIMSYAVRVLPNLWADQGGGVGGSTGTPVLSGQGAPYAGQNVIVGLTHARPSTPATLLIGASAFPLPFFGGTLFPVPQIVLAGLPTDSAGSLLLWTAWPAGVPSGLQLYLQYWLPDPTAPFGVQGSNALFVQTP